MPGIGSERDGVAPMICARSGGNPSCKVLIVQTRNSAEVRQVEEIFAELAEHCPVRILARGVTMAYAVGTPSELALLQDLELFLRDHYKFTVLYDGFNSVIHRIVEDLAIDSDSQLYTLPLCDSCSETTPFPMRAPVASGSRNGRRASLCERCALELEDRDAGVPQEAVLGARLAS